MPITRTNMIDDDGSGTTGTIINNAWKQQFYDQIDALGAGLPIVYGTWLPVDASGAGLSISVSSGTYAHLGRLVFVWADVTYPVNGSAAVAVLGGLPFPNTTQVAGLLQTVGAPVRFQVNAADVVIVLLNATTSVNLTNANVSGTRMAFSGVYLQY